MGVVYDALDRERNTHVALKTMHMVSGDSLLRFKTEFRALQDLHHPNLVRLGELIEENGQWFFTMELVDGVDLLSYVRQHAPRGAAATDPFGHTTMSPSHRKLSEVSPLVTVKLAEADTHRQFDEVRLRKVMPQLALAVAALHGAGKVHRDIKPSNIMVTKAGRAVLLDFGLIAEAAKEEAPESVVGTAAYMAPEQAASRAVTAEADWYSVGVVLYEMLTGRLPFVGTPLQIAVDKQKHEPPPPRQHLPEIPRDLDALCVDLLRFEPNSRPSGREVLRRLGVADSERMSTITTTSNLSSSVFVGRDVELGMLGAAFDDTQDGSAVTMYVRGESGVGKSALINKFTKLLTERDQDTVVLRGRCYERETVPYKAFDGVADALSSYMRALPRDQAAELVPSNAALLSRVFPVLGRVAVIASAPRPRQRNLDPIELRRRAFAALRELLFVLAERHPLVLVIDDLQWADADSLLLLGDLLRPPDPPPLLLLISARIESEDVPSKRLAIPGDVRQIDLDLLDPQSARDLARRLIARSKLIGQVSASLIAIEARGHPLYVDELVRHAALVGGGEIERPRLEEAIWARVSSLNPEALGVLELVCLAGAPLPQQVVFDATDLDQGQFAQVVSLLRVSNLVRGHGGRRKDTIESYHDRVRDAVTQNLADGDRGHRHTRLSEAMESSPLASERPELLLRHLEAAGRHKKGAQYAQDAAKRAVEAFAFEQAAEFYRTALRLGNFAGEELRNLQIALADALAHAGRGADAADYYFAAAEGADPATRLECQHRAAYQLLISGFIERGVESFRRVLEEVGVSYPRTPRRALWSLLTQMARLRVRGLKWKAKHETEIPKATLAKIDVYQDAMLGFSMVDSVRAFDFQTRGLLLALKTGEPSRVLRSLILYSNAYANGNRRIAQGRALIESIRPQVEETDDAYLRGLLHGMDGCLTFFEGRYPASLELVRKGDTMLAESPRTTQGERNSFNTFELFCLHLIGRFRELEACYNRHLRSAKRRGDLYSETTMRRYCNTVWLLRDEPARAREELECTSWTPPTDAFHLQHYFEWRAQIYLMLYENTEAHPMAAMRGTFGDLRGSMLMRAIQGLRSEASWLWGQVCLADAEKSGATHAVRQAKKMAKSLLSERRGYATAMGLLVRAGVEYQVGDDSAAAATLVDAANVSTEHDLEHMAVVARRRRGQIIGGDEGAGLVAEADNWWRNEGGVDPERLTQFVAPGFARAK